MTTVGDEDASRYFWLRLAELVVASEGDATLTEPEILLGRGAYAEWRSWPMEEQRATEAFAAALLLRLRDEPMRSDEVDTWVCAAGQLLDDVTPLLDRVLLADVPAARWNLLALLRANADAIERGTLANPFWRARDEDPLREVLTLIRVLPDASPTLEPSATRLLAWFRELQVQAAAARASRSPERRSWL